MQQTTYGFPIGEMYQWTPRLWQNGELQVFPRYCMWQIVGDFAYVFCNAVARSAGSAGNGIFMSLPAAYPVIYNANAPNYANFVGTGYYYDVGTAIRPLTMMGFAYNGTPPDTKSPWSLVRATLNTGALGDLGSDINFAVASGDEFSFTSVYPLGRT